MTRLSCLQFPSLTTRPIFRGLRTHKGSSPSHSLAAAQPLLSYPVCQCIVCFLSSLLKVSQLNELRLGKKWECSCRALFVDNIHHHELVTRPHTSGRVSPEKESRWSHNRPQLVRRQEPVAQVDRGPRCLTGRSHRSCCEFWPSSFDLMVGFCSHAEHSIDSKQDTMDMDPEQHLLDGRPALRLPESSRLGRWSAREQDQGPSLRRVDRRGSKRRSSRADHLPAWRISHLSHCTGGEAVLGDLLRCGRRQGSYHSCCENSSLSWPGVCV